MSGVVKSVGNAVGGLVKGAGNIISGAGSAIGGGGGSGDTPTVESIPAWMRPFIENAENKTSAAYDQGELSKVAGTSGLQQRAFGGAADAVSRVGGSNLDQLSSQQGRLTDMAKTGGADQLKEALALDIGQGEAQVGQGYGAAGTLGSARQALASKAAEDATRAKFAQTVIGNKAAAENALNTSLGASGATATGTANTLAGLGGQERTIDQQQADATWQGLQRLSSTAFGSPAKQSAVTGGK